MERDERDSGGGEEHGYGEGFLPPEPPGPEPDLGARPEPGPPAPGPQQQPGAQGPPGQPHTPPQQGQPPAYPPPGYAPPGYGHPGYPPPPGYGPPPGQAYPGWGYPPQPQVPDNGQAVAGFILSLVSVGLLLVSAGLSSIVSVGCAIAGIVCSRNGKRKVDAGETPKHGGLAQAGYIIGWVGLALSVLATLAWITFIVVALATEDDDIFNPETTETIVRTVLG